MYMYVCLWRFYLKKVNGNDLIHFATWRGNPNSGFKILTEVLGSRTEYPTSGIPNNGNTQRLECPTLNSLLGIHDNNATNTLVGNTQQ